MNPIWRIFCAIWRIFGVINGQIWKNNLAIWSHCLKLRDRFLGTSQELTRAGNTATEKIFLSKQHIIEQKIKSQIRRKGKNKKIVSTIVFYFKEGHIFRNKNRGSSLCFSHWGSFMLYALTHKNAELCTTQCNKQILWHQKPVFQIRKLEHSFGKGKSHY